MSVSSVANDFVPIDFVKQHLDMGATFMRRRISFERPENVGQFDLTNRNCYNADAANG